MKINKQRWKQPEEVKNIIGTSDWGSMSSVYQNILLLLLVVDQGLKIYVYY